MAHTIVALEDLEAQTAQLYADGAIDHLDLAEDYRVFLLKTMDRVDLTAGGSAPELPSPEGTDLVELARLGWLYALEARDALTAGRWPDAEQAILGVHAAVLALACARYGLSSPEGLPRVATAFIDPAVPASLAEADLRRAHVAAVTALRQEIGFGDRDRAIRLLDPIVTLMR